MHLTIPFFFNRRKTHLVRSLTKRNKHIKATITVYGVRADPGVLVFEGHGVIFVDGMVIDIVVTGAGLVKEVRDAEGNVFSGVISGFRMKLYP